MTSVTKTRSPLLTIFITVFIDLLGVGILIPITAPLLLNTELGILPSEMPIEERTIILGFLIASFPLAQFFGAPILGALSDRFGRKKPLSVSLLGTLIGYLLFGVAIQQENIYLLFFSRALDGFTGGNIAIVLASISDASDKKTKAKNFGMVSAAFGLGFILGPFIGGKLADPSIVSWFTLSTPFWFASILTAINILFVLISFPETLQQPKKTSISLFAGINNIKAAFRLKKLRNLFIVVFLYTIGFNFFTQFFQVFLIGKFDYSISEIANLFGYMGFWIVIVQGGVQRPISKHFEPYAIVRFSLLFLAITLPFLLLPKEPSLLFFILPFIAIFQGLSSPNVISLVSSQANKNEQGQILGINQSIQSLGTAIPPIIASYINNLNINLPIITASFCILLAWLILISFFKTKNTDTP